MKRLFLVLTLLAATTPANAASSLNGLTGLAEMRTPETIGGFNSEFFAGGSYYTVGDNMDNRFIGTLGYTQGLGDMLEAGIKVPVFSNKNATGVHPIPVLLKFKAFELDNGIMAALTGYIASPGSSEELSSGDLNAGIELNAAWDFESWLLAGTAGYKRMDYCPTCVFPGIQLDEPRAVPAPYASLGLRFPFSAHYFIGEVKIQNARNGVEAGNFSGDPELRAVAGGRFAIESLEGLFLTPTLSFGFPAWDHVNHASGYSLLANYIFTD